MESSQFSVTFDTNIKVLEGKGEISQKNRIFRPWLLPFVVSQAWRLVPVICQVLPVNLSRLHDRLS
jgi:hypothetical protein